MTDKNGSTNHGKRTWVWGYRMAIVRQTPMGWSFNGTCVSRGASLLAPRADRSALCFSRSAGSFGATLLLITYEAHVRTCALARDPIQAASMASCNSFGQCWATVTRSRRRKTLE